MLVHLTCTLPGRYFTYLCQNTFILNYNMEKELYQTTLPFTVFEPDMLSGSLTLTAQEWGLESHFRQMCNMKYKTFHRKYKITKTLMLRRNALLTPHQSNSSFLVWTLVLVTKTYMRKISN